MPYSLKDFSEMRINSSKEFNDIWMSWSNIGFNLTTNFLGLPSDGFDLRFIEENNSIIFNFLAVKK